VKFDNIEEFITKFGGVTEEYKFYNNEITLRYDPKDHVYLLQTPTGLVKQDGVTTVCHIVDKSNVLIPWACKMMGQKLKVLANEKYNAGFYQLSDNDLDEVIQQAKTAHKDKLEDAGEVGHAAHGWIEEYIKHLLNVTCDLDAAPYPKPLTDNRATSCVEAALKWIKRHNVRWIHTEKKVYSRDHEYAGTMDGLAHVDSCDDPQCCPVPFKDKLSIIDWKTSNYLYIEYILQTAAYKQAYEEEFGTQVEDIWIIRLGKEDGEFQAWHLPDFLQHLGWVAFLDALNLTRSMRDIEESLQAIKDEKRAERKAKEFEAKQEALKLKCKYADKYKGTRKPRCNKGNPCQACLNKYAEVQAQKVLDKT
jgi:hypothetical protein